MSYRPLPEGLTIKASNIDGLGLFTEKAIEKNTELGSTHFWCGCSSRWLRSPLGGFINHSEDPNCHLMKEYNFSGAMELILHTLNDIEEGEELTLDYRKYGVNNFYEEQ